VLLVESDEEESRRISSVLRADGYGVSRVELAAAGAAGRMASTPPQVALISTAGLPLSSKLTAIRRVEARLEIPVIWMLAPDQADWAERVHQVSSGTCLVKRFTDHQLGMVVEWALRRWHRIQAGAVRRGRAQRQRPANREVAPRVLVRARATNPQAGAPVAGVLACDLSLGCRRWNPTMTELTGLAEAEAQGRFVPDLLLRAGLPGVKLLLQEAGDGHALVTRPLWWAEVRSGQPGWFTLACRPRLGPGRRPIGSVLEIQRAPDEQAEEDEVRQLVRVNRVNEFIRETLDCDTFEALARECCRLVASLTNSPLGFICDSAGANETLPPWWICGASPACGCPPPCAELLKLPELRARCDQAIAQGTSGLVHFPMPHTGKPGKAPTCLQGGMITRIALGQESVALGAAGPREYSPPDLEDLRAIGEAFARLAQLRNLHPRARLRATARGTPLKPPAWPVSPRAMGLDPGSVQAMIEAPPYPGLLGIIGRYHLLTYEGEGGAGVVFHAYDTEEERDVCLKLLRPARDVAHRGSARWQIELRRMADLFHPRIVPLWAISETVGRTYLVMPWMAGGNLAARIDSVRLFPRRLLRVALQVAAGLAFLHSHGIMHRDLKPTNVLLDRRGNAALADFGLARSFMEDATLTDPAWGVEGTVNYLSPALAGGGAEDTRGDIYAFGALLYEMLTGSPPYAGARPAEVLEQIRQGPPPPITSLNPQAPSGLVSIAERALARDLESRYGHMSYVIRDLRGLRQSRSVPA